MMPPLTEDQRTLGDYATPPDRERHRAALARIEELEAALTSIQSHGALNDNDLSMIWTARVALNPDAIDGAPPHLRDVIAARFSPEGESDA